MKTTLQKANSKQQTANNAKLKSRIHRFLILFSVTMISFLSNLHAQTVVPNSLNPYNVEIGQPNSYTFAVLGLPSTANVTKWEISSDIDVCVSGSPVGYINSLNNSTYSVATNSTTITVPVQWGDCCHFEKTAKLKATVTYKSGFTETSTSGTQTVNLYRIPCNIPITGPDVAPNCCPSVLIYSIGDTGDANKFEWSVSSNAQILSGASTKTITVKPGIGNFNVGVTVSRNGNPIYFKTSVKPVSRTDLAATLTIPYYQNTFQNFICKNSGLVATLVINSGGCSNPSITWNAPNCTVTPLNGNTYNIVPSSSLPIASVVHISATVQVNACNVTTQQFDLRVLDSQSPTTPNGYLYYTNDGDFCTADFLEMHFSDVSFTNGDIKITPDFMPGPGDSIHYRPGVQKKFTVCNINLCTGESKCKDFYMYPPAPCADPNAKNASFTISPNPATSEVNLENKTNEDSTYQIFDVNGTLVNSGNVKFKAKLRINTSRLKSGNYTVILFTKSSKTSKQLIIK